jgi:hypothetical protein
MDELIEELDAMDWGEHPAVGKAATALRAYAEREKDLVEALREIALLSNNNRTNKKMLGDKARAILSKHKEQK